MHRFLTAILLTVALVGCSAIRGAWREVRTTAPELVATFTGYLCHHPETIFSEGLPASLLLLFAPLGASCDDVAATQLVQIQAHQQRLWAAASRLRVGETVELEGPVSEVPTGGAIGIASAPGQTLLRPRRMKRSK